MNIGAGLWQEYFPAAGRTSAASELPVEQVANVIGADRVDTGAWHIRHHNLLGLDAIDAALRLIVCDRRTMAQ